MDEDYDEDLADEGLPTGHDAVAPGKGILLLPHRQLHPHPQMLKGRPSVEQEPRGAVLPPHAPHSHLGGQDHGEWTYEEQFRQVGPQSVFIYGFLRLKISPLERFYTDRALQNLNCRNIKKELPSSISCSPSQDC